MKGTYSKKKTNKNKKMLIYINYILIFAGFLLIIDGVGSYVLQFDDIETFHSIYQWGRLLRTLLGFVILSIGFIGLMRRK